VEFNGAPYDCGSKLGYLRATLAFSMSHPELGNDARDMIRSSLEG